jgi:predicted exporter
LQALAAGVFLARKRWRTGVRLLAGSALSVAANIFWTGHVFLSSSWSEPFLMW